MSAVSVEVSCAWRIQRATVRAPAGTDPDDLFTFAQQVMRAAVEAGRAGGPAVAEGVMTAPRLERSA